MATSVLPEHSPLGASGAYRWMVCPGSVSLSEGVQDDESEEAFEGTIAHNLGERCLTEDVEPWRFTGKAMDALGDTMENVTEETVPEGWLLIPKDMIDAVQSYLLMLSEWHDTTQGWVEHGFHCETIHPLYYGRSDYVHIETGTLDVWDYKHGVGIVVEADDNPQLNYYGCGVLESLDLWDRVDTVRLHIYQPRAFHWQGPHRYVETTPAKLREWLDKECVPAMELTEVSDYTEAGEHCRFCPARQLQCPSLMEAMAEYRHLIMTGVAIVNGVGKWTDEQLAAFLRLEKLAKIVAKDARKKAWAKLSNGRPLQGLKLVPSRVNRVMRDGAEEAAEETFGEKAYTSPELKSPTQLEELPGGKAFTAEWAFKPEGGTTVALDKDPRRALRRDATDLFKPVEG